MTKIRVIPIFILSIVVAVGMLTTSIVRADTVDELRNKINKKNQQIENIEEEIAAYREELKKVGAEKQSLQSAIRQLDISRQKLTADIAATEQRIEGAELTIDKLNLEIEEQSRKINLNNETLGETIRRINEAENQTLVETLLSHERLSEVWGDIGHTQQLQSALGEDLAVLYDLKTEFEAKKRELEGERQQLAEFQSELVGQRQVVDANKNEKGELLAVTQNKEANYQALIAEKERLRAQFERDREEFEQALQFEIDPESIPPTGSGVLSWPVDSPTITQYFGNTPFASANPQVYSGNGHNGIDLAAPTGTKIKAALSGTVLGTGDTDQTCRNASYGKWVLIRHNNGLTTLYAHLSHISASKGDSVHTGQTIGFSGNTGYSTGPHLHFTVYASQGVTIDQLPSRVCGKVYTIPLADREAYLNPLSYL